ncbi:MAG: AzlC family ABC transporter permease [Pseudonocardia sp.]|nr:AzlC family ABC transporter permease [Pseudonocardia sp.]MBO0873474.1 AzlC family ABC transporter permease [Pseudonocardia sp.]
MRSIWRTSSREDLRDALALGAAIVVVGASFGALAATAGMPLILIVAMSMLVFAGGSQFLAVAVIASGGAPIAAVLGGLLLNARHLPFGLAVADVVGRSWPARLLGTHFMVDESVAFARSRPDPVRARRVYWLVGITLFVAWNLGTVVGALVGSAVPAPARFGVDAAFPSALLALLLPTLSGGDAARVALSGAVLALLATPWVPAGVPVLVALAGLLAAGRPAASS